MRTSVLASWLLEYRIRNVHDDHDLTEPFEEQEANEVDGSVSDQDQSASEEEDQASHSYASLLQSLSAKPNDEHPVRKRRKLGSVDTAQPVIAKVSPTPDETRLTERESQEMSPHVQELEVQGQEQVEEAASLADSESDSEEQTLHDPFEKHYALIPDQELKASVEHAAKRKRIQQGLIILRGATKMIVSMTADAPFLRSLAGVKDMHLKRRLNGAGETVASSLDREERDVATCIFQYRDVVYGRRSIGSPAHLRDLCCLHALNHIFKTRDTILKDNSRLSQSENAELLELRDQGFTRPKVLIVLPTKQACVRFAESIVKLCQPEQQENKARFLETYSREDDDEWLEKPEDFRELFGGNHEEDFRIGLKFTRKTIKYFSGFYNSDIILGSPLGLMRTITTGGGGKDKKKGHDADFLSSIEVIVMDHTNALQMQNWQHVEYIFSQLNLLPKDSHGCDFSRVRNWYLDGNAKHLRQTIILSDYITPEINALASAHLSNIAGRVKIAPSYQGTMLDIATNLPITVNQTFLRFDAANPLDDGDARFKYFTTSILPPMLRDTNNQKGILIFVPTYLDFVRVRNHLSTSVETTSLSFGSISEYTEVREVARTRSHFLSGRHHVLLYSERAHHHFRYKIKGVRKVIFYGIPENPIFWSEVVGMLGLNPDVMVGQGNARKGKGLVRAMFSKWDVLKLERIVGTDRVGRLVSEKGGDTFDFV